MTYSALTLVCFAVKEEARYFRQSVRSRENVRVLLTGMGQRNARLAVQQALLELAPGRVLTAGFAGGLSPQLERGTVLFSADPSLGLEPGLLAAGARPARFYCTNRVVTTAAQKRALHAETGAEAVEMESGCIHALCKEAGVPAATVRVILDTALEDLALDFNQLMTPDHRLDGWKLALALAKAPGKISALLRLQRESNAAAKRLSEVLEKILL